MSLALATGPLFRKLLVGLLSLVARIAFYGGGIGGAVSGWVMTFALKGRNKLANVLDAPHRETRAAFDACWETARLDACPPA